MHKPRASRQINEWRTMSMMKKAFDANAKPSQCLSGKGVGRYTKEQLEQLERVENLIPPPLRKGAPRLALHPLVSVKPIVVTCVHPIPRFAPLGLGMILAYALKMLPKERFDLGPRFVNTKEELAAAHEKGALNVFLFSSYVWNTVENLELSRFAKEIDPDCYVVHGGPNTPGYEWASDEFLRRNPEVDFAVRGEGELTLVDLLLGIEQGDPKVREVPSVSYLEGGVCHRNPERVVKQDIDSFPSPYLTGVFKGVDHKEWKITPIVTNRGCPYRCAYCSWDKWATSKDTFTMRQYDMERVKGEIDWIASRQIPGMYIGDSNFGMLERDVEIARLLAAAKAEHGYPRVVDMNYAKNTHRNLVEIVETFVDSGLVSRGVISIQTRDPHTLETINRLNIKPREYDKLSKVFHDKGMYFYVQLMMALPGSTVESFKEDLRFYFYTNAYLIIFKTYVLPNSPMAHRDYMEDHKIVIGEEGFITSTKTMSEHEIELMTGVACLYSGIQRFKILQLPIMYLHSDHGLDPLETMEALANDLLKSDKYPTMRRLIDLKQYNSSMHFRNIIEDHASHNTWEMLNEEFVEWACDKYSIALNPAYESALLAQSAYMRVEGRLYPVPVSLPHDTLAWRQNLMRGVVEPLSSYPPGEFLVEHPVEVPF